MIFGTLVLSIAQLDFAPSCHLCHRALLTCSVCHVLYVSFRKSLWTGLRKNLRQDAEGRWRWHWDPAFIDRGRLGKIEALRDRQTIGTFHDPDRMLRAARNLEVPVLLVRGRASDVVAEEGARELLDAVPHARYADVSDAGHMVAGDRNDAFNAAVIGFLCEAFDGPG